MAIATKNVEEKDSKTVALISLLVTVFFGIVVIVVLNTHLTRKNGPAYQICVHLYITQCFYFQLSRYFSIIHLGIMNFMITLFTQLKCNFYHLFKNSCLTQSKCKNFIRFPAYHFGLF